MRLLLDMIQPSQLYINRLKLNAVLNQIETSGIESIDPIPIKELNNEMVATDGHTRLFAYHLLGKEDIKIEWDIDDLDWEMYQICVNWAHDNDIYAIRHLEGRIIENQDYQRLWIDRCQNLKKQLEVQRNGNLKDSAT